MSILNNGAKAPALPAYLKSEIDLPGVCLSAPHDNTVKELEAKSVECHAASLLVPTALASGVERVAPYPVLKPDECLTKKERVLNHLTHYGSINRFEASRLLYDTALNSTISFLANTHGIAFEKQWESVPNRAGGSTKVKRYTLSTESGAAALDLLDRWRVTP